MSIPVIVFGHDARTYITAIESQRGAVSVCRHTYEASELLGLAQTGIARAVLIIGEHPDLTLSFYDQLCSQELGVVVVADSQLKQVPGQVLQLPLTVGQQELIAAIETATAAAGSAPLSSPAVKEADELENRQQAERAAHFFWQGQTGAAGRILTFWSGAGSPGRSTLAVNCASIAASQGQRVCLVDADTYAPCHSALLGMLEDYSGLAQLCHQLERSELTSQVLAEAVSRVHILGQPLDVLTGITRAERWPELRTKSLVKLFAFLKNHYDLVLVDTAANIEEDEELSFDGFAPRRNGATLTCLEEADRVIMVGSADVLGIPRLLKAYEELAQCSESKGISVHKIAIWINKVRKQAAGANPHKSIQQAWQRFGPACPISGFVPYDQQTLDRSWLSGKTLIESAAKSELTQSMQALLAQTLQQNPDGTATQKIVRRMVRKSS